MCFKKGATKKVLHKAVPTKVFRRGVPNMGYKEVFQRRCSKRCSKEGARKNVGDPKRYCKDVFQNGATKTAIQNCVPEKVIQNM